LWYSSYTYKNYYKEDDAIVKQRIAEPMKPILRMSGTCGIKPVVVTLGLRHDGNRTTDYIKLKLYYLNRLVCPT
jgi:hypothetical protein